MQGVQRLGVAGVAEVVAAGSEVATAVLLARVAAAVMLAERSSACRACAWSAASRCLVKAARRRILATVSRCPDTAAASLAVGARGLAGAVEPVALRRQRFRNFVSLRPFSAASRASRSFCTAARARPSIPVMTSSIEVAPRITAIGSGSPWM